MRRFLRVPFVRLLSWLARGVLQRYRPTVIAVTGSVGKTLTKEAIFHVLAGETSVWKSEHNLNTDVGVPLAIFGVPQVPHRLGEWWSSLGQGLRVRFSRTLYPELLVLEFAADRPRDIALLAKLARPTVGVVTAVGATHLLRFGTIENVAREKGALIQALPDDGFAVLNGDDPLVRNMRELTGATVATFGFSDEAEVRALKPKLVVRGRTLDAADTNEPAALSFSLWLEGKHYSVTMHGFAAPYQLLSALAAAAVARSFAIEPAAIVRRLETLRPLPGRMRLLTGVRHAAILDDSYNASPLAVQAALETLAAFPRAKRRIAVLGEMAELGAASGASHEEMGRVAAKCANLLIAVGQQAHGYIEGALAAQLDGDALLTAEDSLKAGEWLRQNLRSGDVVLIKGSQVARMEKAVAAALLEPDRARELLVRQDDFWRHR